MNFASACMSQLFGYICVVSESVCLWVPRSRGGISGRVSEHGDVCCNNAHAGSQQYFQTRYSLPFLTFGALCGLPEGGSQWQMPERSVRLPCHVDESCRLHSAHVPDTGYITSLPDDVLPTPMRMLIHWWTQAGNFDPLVRVPHCK